LPACLVRSCREPSLGMSAGVVAANLANYHGLSNRAAGNGRPGKSPARSELS
jgi:hypothetical protein